MCRKKKLLQGQLTNNGRKEPFRMKRRKTVRFSALCFPVCKIPYEQSSKILYFIIKGDIIALLIADNPVPIQYGTK